MLVVVISLDEINMVVCQVVYLFFNILNCIVCICFLDYVCDVDKFFYFEVVLIDYLIVLEQLVIDNIYCLIEYLGVLQVVNFVEGKVSLVVVKVYYGGLLIGNVFLIM